MIFCACDEVLVTSREAQNILAKKTAILIGPGAGASQDLEKFLKFILSEKFSQAVIDADALTILAGSLREVSLPPQWILTPHTGELSKLLNVSADEIEKDRIYHVSLAAKKFGCHVVLKGFRTLIATPHAEKVMIIPSGNQALAKAGSGDVLSGMISGFLAQKIKSFDAACLGAFLHGKLADDWLRKGNDVVSLMPRDLLQNLSHLLAEVRTT